MLALWVMSTSVEVLGFSRALGAASIIGQIAGCVLSFGFIVHFGCYWSHVPGNLLDDAADYDLCLSANIRQTICGGVACITSLY